MKKMKFTKAHRERLEIYRKAVRHMWAAGARAAGRDPRLEIRAFDSGWDAAFEAIKLEGSR